MAPVPLNILPEYLQQKSIPLAGYGVASYAWLAPDAQEVIVWLRKSDLAILGGDVLRWTNDQRIEFTNDGWYLNKQPEWSWNEYVARSCEHTRRCVLAYLTRNPEGIAFDFVVADSERKTD